MKKVTHILIGTLCACSLFSLASCGGTAGDPNTLHIICLDASYGTTWIQKLKEEFEKSHEGITVDIQTSYNSESLIDSHLSSSKNVDDLYISTKNAWKTKAAQGQFLELDSLLEEEVDGKKIKDKVASEYRNSLSFAQSNGEKHCYRLPWTSGIGGIFYNEVMFKENHWDTYLKEKYSTNTSGVPETFEQLIDLCNKIVEDDIPVKNDRINAVKPFAYTGANTDYFDYLVFNWWGQIAGKEAIQEFLKYESFTNYDCTQNETYAALKTATEYWGQLFTNPNYVIAGSESKTAANAQKEFVNGASAMMINGDWLYHDTLSYTSNGSYNDSFQLKLMKTPTLPETKFKDTAYVIGEDQYISIPKTAPNADLAKEFIKLMISDKGCNTFLSESNGFLAYDATYDESSIQQDAYVKSAIEVRDSYTDKFTNFSDNRKYLCNFIDIWCSSGQRPYLSMLNNTSTLDTSFANIATYAKANWESWTKQSA